MLCVSTVKRAGRGAERGVDNVAVIQSDRRAPPKLSPTPGAAGRGQFGSKRSGTIPTRASAVSVQDLASTASLPSSRAMQRVREWRYRFSSTRLVWRAAKRAARRRPPPVDTLARFLGSKAKIQAVTVPSHRASLLHASWARSVGGGGVTDRPPRSQRERKIKTYSVTCSPTRTRRRGCSRPRGTTS